MTWHHVSIPATYFGFGHFCEYKFFIEKCKANTRTVSVTYYTYRGDVLLKRFERIIHPDLLFVTAYRINPDAGDHEARTNCYCVTPHMGQMWSVTMPNRLTASRICLGTAKPEIVARAVVDQPPRLVETFWNTDFTLYLNREMIKQQARIPPIWEREFPETHGFIPKIIEHSEAFQNALREE